MWWKILLSILTTVLPALFAAGEGMAGHTGTAATFGAVTLAGGGFSAWLLGLLKNFKLPVSVGTPAEFSTAIAELKDVGPALVAVVRNPKDFSAAKELIIQFGEAQLAVGDWFVDDAEWSAEAVKFLALTKAKLDAAAPKTASGKPIEAGLISFADAAR